MLPLLFPCSQFLSCYLIRVSEAARPTPTTASLRQRLFHTLVEPVWAPSATLDITHTPTAQELLAHKVLQNLEEEKAESKRYAYITSKKKSFGKITLNHPKPKL